MNVTTAYRVYTALRLHFTTDTNNYDIRRGIIPKEPKKGISESFKKRLNVIQNRYTTKESFVNYFVSNFLNGDSWGGLFDDGGDVTYKEWVRKKDSLTYSFQQEVEILHKYIPTMEDLWDCSNGHPPILRAYCGKICTIETLVILNKLYKFRRKIDEHLNNDPVWNNVSIVIQKYSPFLNVDKEKFLMLTNSIYNE